MQERNRNIKLSQNNILKPKAGPVAETLKPQKENIATAREEDPRELRAENTLIPFETKKIKKFYLEEILNHEILKTGINYRPEFLKNHKVNPEIRARMIDWMIEVLSSFNCTTNTFFVAVDLMDTFFELITRKLETKDIHMIGVTSMLISSKMEEVIPFKVHTVVEKMTHNKLKAKEIVECEMEILRSLNFSLLRTPSIYIIIEFLIVKLNLHLLEIKSDLFKVITYISKMLIHDYNLLIKFPMKYLAASCIYICFKIIEQVNKEFKTKIYVEKLKTYLELDEVTFFKSSELVLNLAKNFETQFPYAKNLQKFDAFTLDEKIIAANI